MILTNRFGYTLWLSLLTLNLIFQSCKTIPDEDPEATGNIPQSILIFVDKSASVSFQQPGVQQKSQSILKHGIDQISSADDALKLLVIHDKTRAASPVANYEVPQFSCKPNLPPLAIKAARNAYKKEIGKQKLMFFSECTEFLSKPLDNENKRGTDIVGVLEVISRMERKDVQKEIYLFTDGKQSSKEFIVNPKNKQEAERLAIQHVQKINRELAIKPEVLRDSFIHFVLPYEANSTKYDPNLTYYWEKLFNEYKISVNFM
ncbi:hypothetical protein EXU57_08185 [Segetibacter sp. 3557_3]|uniref:hypothetical protein n=1 Tax=Segetibacter sp. 3557_3 TaxID=2547429 RepID=UPI001058FF40|nr:hypothetical protein [Segetibacter sp. 3557_3]TDH26780.1 hypothetical protein EXU57_08185 [Segetibacter sp. 3557_3]